MSLTPCFFTNTRSIPVGATKANVADILKNMALSSSG